jgi:hypothetical protein
MGLGLGFCCCTGCTYFQDLFEREAIGDDWTIQAGDWSIDNADFPDLAPHSKYLATSSENAKILCNQEADVDGEEYVLDLVLRTKSTGDSRWLRIFLGDDVYLRIKCHYGAGGYCTDAEIYEGGVLVKQCTFTWYGYIAFMVWMPAWVHLRLWIDGARLILTANGYPGAAGEGDAWVAASTIGTQIALGTESLGGGDFAAFDGFTIGRRRAGCYGAGPLCDGWLNGVLPGHVYADVNFVGNDSGNPCPGGCDAFNGIWEMFRGKSGWSKYAPCLGGCDYSEGEPGGASCGITGTDYWPGFSGGSCHSYLQGFTHLFSYSKVFEGLYRATYQHRISSPGTGFVWGSTATFQKDYTEPASPGWSDSLPLVDFVENPSRWKGSCFAYPGYYGSAVEISTT